MELKQLSEKIQVKFNQFSYRFAAGLSRPKQKFVRQMVFGILKSGQVQLNAIGRALQEKLPLKKTTKRLGFHLGVKGLWVDITTGCLQAQRSYLKQCHYLIVDLSDIQKSYARQMEGLARVYDGSQHDTGSGYWLCNIAGVDKSGSLIVPAYSELYSLAQESSSENEKLLSAIRSVSQVAGQDKIVVMDRGADREMIMNQLLQDNQPFIIRQVGNRDLYVRGQRTPLKQISRSVKLTETYRVSKLSKNRKVRECYSCGAVKVKLTPTGADLWLVVLKEQGRGYCWLLCHLTENHKRAAIATAFKGYGHRWKIEEVHRQIKMDYELEKICLQRYEALKSLNALLWTTVSFLYTRLDNMSIDIITHIELGLQNRKTWSELIRFVYYKLAWAIKKLLTTSKLYLSPVLKIPDSDQLCLTLGCS